MMRWILVLLCALWAPTTAFAQQRPLVTEDPETVGAGRLLLEYGFDYGRGVEYPTSGLQGNLLRLHLIGISVGVSSIAEIQVDGGFYNRLSITDRDPTAPLADVVTATDDSTTSVQDFTIGTKIKIIAEGMTSPGFGIRFATKLPNASNESGIGLDTTDFFISAIGAKTIQSVRVVGNLGLAILADPTRGDRQNDVLTYGASFARAITMSTEIVGEVNGHVDTRKGAPLPGTESRSIVRIGGRYTRGSWRGDAALLFGLASVDPGFGVAGGFTYVFDAFMVP